VIITNLITGDRTHGGYCWTIVQIYKVAADLWNS